MEQSEKEYKYLKAKEKVEKIKKFYSSLLSYIIILAFLAALNFYTNRWHHPWFLWVALGLGISIVFKAIKVFEYNPFFDKDWEKRKLKELMDNDINPKKNTKWK
ncbi:MAG: histidine kinase [Flavobacteriales bacterium]|nr:MAG: histidine kinase [Flavobacteriales bacterium]